MHFKMSSAISFNLDQSKILSSGNGLISGHLPDSGFIRMYFIRIGKFVTGGKLILYLVYLQEWW